MVEGTLTILFVVLGVLIVLPAAIFLIIFFSIRAGMRRRRRELQQHK